MATVRPFRGFRYVPERVDLSLVLAPGGDIDAAARDALYDKEPRNAVRVVAGRPEPGEPEDAPARRAALHLAEWRRAGVVAVDDHPSLYLLRQTLPAEKSGEERELTGFYAAVRLDAAGRRDVHDASRDDTSDDDAEQVEALRRQLAIVGMHTDPVLLRYSDAGGRIERALRAEMEEREPDVRARCEEALYELWVVDDETTTARVARHLEDQPLSLLEGSQRFRAALALERSRATERPAGVLDTEPMSVIALFVSGEGSSDSDYDETRATPRPPRGVVFSPLMALGDDDS